MKALAPRGLSTRVAHHDSFKCLHRLRACSLGRALHEAGVAALGQSSRKCVRRRNVTVHAVFRHFDRRAMKVVSVAQLKARWLGYSEVRASCFVSQE